MTKKGGLDGYRLQYESVNGDRGKRWPTIKLKRPTVHYVLVQRVSFRNKFNRGLLAVVSKFSKDITK